MSHYSSVDYSSITISRIGRLDNFSKAIERDQGQVESLFKGLHREDRARILTIFTASGIEGFSQEEIAIQSGLKGRVQTEVQMMQEELTKIASSEKRGKSALPGIPQILMSHAISSFLPLNEPTTLQTAYVGDSSRAASRFHRLNKLSQAVEQNKPGVGALFQELHKADRARILEKMVGKFKIQDLDGNLSGHNAFKAFFLKEIDALKSKYGFTPPSLRERMNHMKKLPPIIMTHPLGGLLLPQEMVDLQTTNKAASRVPSPAFAIIQTNHLAPLIETYLNVSCKTLNKQQKAKALGQLMTMAFELSKIENLPQPSYQSLAAFFELIEARNLIRMMKAIHEKQPLSGLEHLLRDLEIPKAPEAAIEKAKILRDWIEQDKHILSTIETLNLNYRHLNLLPKEIGQLKALKVLSLNHAGLILIPKEIGGLRALKELWLGYNHLKELPEEIEQLRALRILQITANRFTILPRGVEQLTLESLDFRENGLIDLPVAMKYRSNQLYEQNEEFQCQTIVHQLIDCVKGEQEVKLKQLLKTLQRFFGKKALRQLRKCLVEVVRENSTTHQVLRNKLKDPHFGRKGFLDKEIKPVFKIAAIERFWEVMKPEIPKIFTDQEGTISFGTL